MAFLYKTQFYVSRDHVNLVSAHRVHFQELQVPPLCGTYGMADAQTCSKGITMTLADKIVII
mgnify:CR=1 FL=1